jgi:hypothetical protein
MFYVLPHSQNIKPCAEFKRSSLVRVASEGNSITSIAMENILFMAIREEQQDTLEHITEQIYKSQRN